MRSLMPGLLFAVLAMAQQLAEAAPASTYHDELQRLEQAWHQCLREAYVHQPAGQSRAGNQRNALDECEEHETAYVAASIAAQAANRAAGDPSLPTRARGWAASVASYVLDPITDWIGSLKR